MNNLQEIVNQNIQGLINPSDFLEILTEMERFNPKVILEIGTRQGYSSRAFYDAFHPELLITIDILSESEMPGGIQKIHGDPNVHYVVGDTNLITTAAEVQELLAGRKVDVLFIDGDHMEQTVRRDFKNYSPFVRPGGLIIMHDTQEQRVDLEVWKVWPEIRANHNTREIPMHEGNCAAGVGFVYV